MKANTVERFVIEKVHRSQIHGASYNPRRISEQAAKKLRGELKDIGLLSPVVVNRLTMNIVSGHQRLVAMDKLMRTEDYELQVAFVELNEKQEIRANVLMNNQSVMGEWDVDKLAEIKLELPEIDFTADLGFDKADLSVMFAGMEELGESIMPTIIEMKTEAERMAEADKFKAAKKQQRDAIHDKQNDSADTWAVEKDDYSVTFVFNTNTEKHEFMRRIRKPQKDRFVKATVLYDIAKNVYSLTGPVEQDG